MSGRSLDAEQRVVIGSGRERRDLRSPSRTERIESDEVAGPDRSAFGERRNRRCGRAVNSIAVQPLGLCARRRVIEDRQFDGRRP